MTAYLSFEWLKLSRRWMPRIIFLLLLGGLAFYFWGEARHAENQVNLLFPRAWLATLYVSAFFATFLWPVLGGSWAGNEYGWGTIRLILTRRPGRTLQSLAGLLVLLATVLLALLGALVAGSVFGMIVGLATGHGAAASGILTTAFAATVLKTLLAAWLVAAFYLVVAYGAATIFRSAAVGIGIGLGLTLAQLILYGVLRSLGGFWLTIAQHLPLDYAQALTQDVAAAGFAPGSGAARIQGDPAINHSLLALTVYTAIVLVATFTVVRVRDVTD